MPSKSKRGVPQARQVRSSHKQSGARPKASWDLSDDDEDLRPRRASSVGVGMLGIQLGEKVTPRMYKYVDGKKQYFKPGDNMADYTHFKHSDFEGHELTPKHRGELRRLANNIKIRLHQKYALQKTEFNKLEELLGAKPFETLEDLTKNFKRLHDKIYSIHKGADGYEQSKYKDIRTARAELANTFSQDTIDGWKKAVKSTLHYLHAGALETDFDTKRSNFERALGLMHWLSHAKKFIYRALEHAVHERQNSNEKFAAAATIGSSVSKYRKDLEHIYAILKPDQARPARFSSRSP